MVEQADGQESGIADDATAVEIDGDLLPSDVPEGKLLRTVCRHDVEPPDCGKCYVSCNLLTTGGSFFKLWVRKMG